MSSDYVHILEVGLGVTFSVLLALVAYWVRRIDTDLTTIVVRVANVEGRLSEYKEKHAVGETQLLAIRSMLAEHVEREENVAWKRIDEIDKENQKAHQKLFDGLSSLHGDVRELVGMMSNQFKPARNPRKERA